MCIRDRDPGGHAQIGAFRRFDAIPAPEQSGSHRGRAAEPGIAVGIVRRRSQRVHRRGESLVVERRHEGPEVGRLHQAGSAAGDDHEAPPPQLTGDAGNAAEGHRRAQHAVAAHEADGLLMRRVQEAGDQSLDRGVVQARGDDFSGVERSRIVGAGLPRPTVNPRVECALQRGRLVRRISLVQGANGIEFGWMRGERDRRAARHGGEPGRQILRSGFRRHVHSLANVPR